MITSPSITRSGSWVALLALLLAVAGCAETKAAGADRGSTQVAGETAARVMIANPASVNCIEQGGTLAIRKRGEGGEYGICTFADGRQCEEWALMRGECPAGGVRVIGSAAPEARYCVIAGGSYTAGHQSNTRPEEGRCTFPDGRSCNARDYYEGRCSRYP